MFRHFIRIATTASCLVAMATPVTAGDFEQKLLGLINEYRVENNLPELTADSRLDELAAEHSRTMQQARMADHTGFKGRFKRSGSNSCVENVGWSSKEHPPVDQFLGWKRSPGHNKNMLAPQITKGGIGKAGTYITFFACK